MAHKMSRKPHKRVATNQLIAGMHSNQIRAALYVVLSPLMAVVVFGVLSVLRFLFGLA